MNKIYTIFFVLAVLLSFASCSKEADDSAGYNTSFQAISSGNCHQLVLDISGNIWAYGNNRDGEYGNGNTTSNNEKFIQVLNGIEYQKIVAGSNFSMAIDASGNLWAWGDNSSGQLGNGRITNELSPIQVKVGTKFKCIAASAGYGGSLPSHALAIDEAGSLWAWGDNGYGQIGNGTTTDQPTPVKIKSGTYFKAVAASWSHSLAIDVSGNLWAWGNNMNGQVGSGSTSYQIKTPVIIKSGTKFKYIAAGGGQSFAIDESDNLWAWGENDYSQLGDGTTNESRIPIQIMTGTKFKCISGGSIYTWAIDNTGNLFEWGSTSSVPKHIKTNKKFIAVSGFCWAWAIDESGNLLKL